MDMQQTTIAINEVTDQQADEAVKQVITQIEVQYISEWDGGIQVSTQAIIDLLTGVVSPEVSDDDNDYQVEVLDRQFVQLKNDTEFEVEEVDGLYVVRDLKALWDAVGYSIEVI